jgi:hypothetical protein
MTDAGMIVGIIIGVIVILSIFSWLWSNYISSSSNSDTGIELSTPTVGGYRKWKRAMRKLRK